MIGEEKDCTMLKEICGIMRDVEQEEQAYQRRCRAVGLACIGLREHAIARMMAKHELESDEFFTAREKALLLL
jgi:hypothetical protein